jgi:hypothetical protein
MQKVSNKINKEKKINNSFYKEIFLYKKTKKKRKKIIKLKKKNKNIQFNFNLYSNIFFFLKYK